jgi:hypothetical protein
MRKELEEFRHKLKSLRPAPFDDVVAELCDLLEPIEKLDQAEEVIPEVFAFMEEHPEVDIGSPGPLVHFVERFYPIYVEQLIVSLERQPTHNALWMLNRILNSNLSSEQRERLITVLCSVHSHRKASSIVKDEAAEFLDHQNKNG